MSIFEKRTTVLFSGTIKIPLCEEIYLLWIFDVLKNPKLYASSIERITLRAMISVNVFGEWNKMKEISIERLNLIDSCRINFSAWFKFRIEWWMSDGRFLWKIFFSIYTRIRFVCIFVIFSFVRGITWVGRFKKFANTHNDWLMISL